MPGRGARPAAAIASIAVALTIGSGTASATTFCVPDFHPACPNSGGNVKEADVEKAMGLSAKDGSADRIVIAPGTFTEDGSFEPEMGTQPGSYEPAGFDPLTIDGAGPKATVLTSSGTGNIFLVNFASNNSRAITVRDLTFRIPTGFGDGLGAAIQSSGDKFENVDIVSLNPESDGITSVGKGNAFVDGELRGESGGSIGDAIRPGGTGGTMLVEDSTILGCVWGLAVSGKEAELTARRVRVVDAGAYGVAATGGTAVVENTTITVDEGIGVYSSANEDDAAVRADHLTILNTGGNTPAVEGKKFGTKEGDVAISVSNSIFQGFASGYKAETAIGPGIGTVSIEVGYSRLPTGGTNVNGAVDVETGNIDADPLLAADLSLGPGSPAVDAGDPASGGLATDFLGAARPVDGDGDGSARRDMGAFEYQPPKKPEPAEPGGPSDTAPPQTTLLKRLGKKLAKGIARFRFRSSEAGSTFICRLDKRRARPCRSPRVYKRLRPGRHVFRVWAVDASGNRDPTPAKRRFRIPRP